MCTSVHIHVYSYKKLYTNLYFFKYIHAYICQCSIIFCQMHLAPGDGVAPSDIAIVYSFEILSTAYPFSIFPPLTLACFQICLETPCDGVAKRGDALLYWFLSFFTWTILYVLQSDMSFIHIHMFTSSFWPCYFCVCRSAAKRQATALLQEALHNFQYSTLLNKVSADAISLIQGLDVAEVYMYTYIELYVYTYIYRYICIQINII